MSMLLCIEEVCALTRLSAATWRRRQAEGVGPRPIQIGKSVRWSAEELREWLAAGAQGRHTHAARGD